MASGDHATDARVAAVNAIREGATEIPAGLVSDDNPNVWRSRSTGTRPRAIQTDTHRLVPLQAGTFIVTVHPDLAGHEFRRVEDGRE